MLPIVTVKGCETVGFDGEVAHQKVGGPVFFIDEPLYPSSPRAFFSYRRILDRAHIDFVQS